MKLILILITVAFISNLSAQYNSGSEPCLGDTILIKNYIYSDSNIFNAIVFNDTCNPEKSLRYFYKVNFLDTSSLDTIQKFSNYVELFYDDEFQNRFLLTKDLNFDNLNDLLIYYFKKPWPVYDPPSYSVWLYDKPQGKFIYNGDISAILASGGYWEIDSVEKKLNINFENGCSECWQYDSYKFENGKYILVESSTTYDGFGLGYRLEKLIDGVMTIISPYERKDTYPFPELKFYAQPFKILQDLPIYRYNSSSWDEPTQNDIYFTLSKQDTIYCDPRNMIFDEFGKVVVSKDTYLNHRYFSKDSIKFIDGDTLTVYFLDGGKYEFWNDGEYYIGKPFWKEERVLNNSQSDVLEKITGSLIEEPKIIWWMQIKDNKGREGYIKLENEQVSLSYILKILKPI